ncbi:putative Ig domain-containing protein [Paenibacillus sp. sgz500992]|uniref:putative Ig domain-containing protein n=1 Tax=Paenibacillus sp. sgz500992 TaxID=3242476 RepID=UPI0036D3A0E9
MNSNRATNLMKSIASILCISMIISFFPYLNAKASAATTLNSTSYEPTILSKVNPESGFVHPGIGVTKSELENVRTQIKNGADPWKSYFNAMSSSPYASKSYGIKNQDSSDPAKAKFTYSDYSSSFMQNIIGPDAQAAFTQALLYYFTGDEAYRNKSITILRLWSQLDPSQAKYVVDGHIKMSYAMYFMVSAAELLKYTSTESPDLVWTEADNTKFITNYVKPANENFFAGPTSVNFWMNQFGYALVGRMSADLFMDDATDYAKSVEMATVNSKASVPENTGALAQVMKRVLDDGLVSDVDDSVIQVAEMGRDQPHAAANITCLAQIAYMLEAQGTKVNPSTGAISTASDAVSMFHFKDDRLLKGANYFSKYNLGYETTWHPIKAYDTIADFGRGRFYDFYMMYYYYQKSGVDMNGNDAKYFTEAFHKAPSPENAGVEFWLHIPASAAGTAVNSGNTNPIEVEKNRYTLLSGTATEESDNTTSYLKLDAGNGGTEIAVLNIPALYNRDDYCVLALKIKTNGVSQLKLRRDASSEPFKTVNLPNTNGTWTYVTVNMNIKEVPISKFPGINIVILSLEGDSRNYLAIDHIKVSPTDNRAPQFENSATEITVNTYVGHATSASFEATDANSGDTLTYTMINGPDEAALDPSTGEFTWTPATSGSYSFLVQVNDGKATSMLTATVNVKSNIEETVAEIMAPYDRSQTYTRLTDNACNNAYSAIEQLIADNETNQDTLNTALNNLQEAVNNLTMVTPLLNDGSINYVGRVTSSVPDVEVSTLVDGDTQTWVTDLWPPNAYFTFDFGSDFKVSATSFQMQSRKYFPNRIWGSEVFGSIDGINWTKLTNASITGGEQMVDLPVMEEYKNVQFRYLKINASARPFSPAEFRIFGSLYETTNQIKSVSIKSSNVIPTRALPKDRVTLTFETKEAIKDVNVIIDGQQAAVTADASGRSYSAEITLDDQPTIGLAQFAIKYNTLNEQEGIEAKTVTDDSSVFLSNEVNLIHVMDGSVDFVDSNGRTGDDLVANINKLFDNNSGTSTDLRVNGSGAGSYAIFDFKDKGVNLSRVEVLATQNITNRLVGLTILGSNDGSTWTSLSSDGVTSTKKWQVLQVGSNTTYRYIKITNPNSWFGNMAELRLFKR